ncbi:MAG: DUF3179 domain-containing (seleno)protein [Pseudomonadota bacterium]
MIKSARAYRALTLVAALTLAPLVISGPAASQALSEFGTAPDVPEGAVSEDLSAALDTAFIRVFEDGSWGPDQGAALAEIAASGDPRVAWILTDMMRFTFNMSFDSALAEAAEGLLNIELTSDNAWNEITDHLIAWDIPAIPDYLRYKRAIFTSFVPGWEALMVEGDIDWRLVSWGGVLIDDRPFDDTDRRCNCIPAADNPPVLSADEATWPRDGDIVFGIEINGETRAYPRQIMEVREMVNDTLGGRDLAIPYCTLCGAAQAYFTDALPIGIERPVMRTSGLLIRSNKVMYDITSGSIFDTFRGNAVTGPLAERGLVLEQASVITTTWVEWRTAHPETTVLVQALALGRNPDFRNGRDADGPIFPVGDVDPRLGVHDDVIGVIAASGTPWAFERGDALLALAGGESIEVENIRVVMDGGGLRAEDAGGGDLSSHEAFWFAWSQFYPETELWTGAADAN